MPTRIALPPNLSGVHTIFCAFVLDIYHDDGDYIRKFNLVVLDKNINYEKETIAILYSDVQRLRTKYIKPIKF